MLLLLLGWAGVGCATSDGSTRSQTDATNRVYAADLDDVLEGVQRAIRQTQSDVTDYEETPSGYVLHGQMSNIYARSGGRGTPELLGFRVIVSSTEPNVTRVQLQPGQTSSYGARSGSEFAQAFFAALEDEGFRRRP